MLGSHDGENFTLYRSRTVLDSVDNVKVENVKPGVNLVAHESRGLLNEAFNLTVFFGDYDTVAAGLFHTSDYDSSLFAMASVEIYKLVKRILANHI